MTDTAAKTLAHSLGTPAGQALQSSPEQAAIQAMAHPRRGQVRWVCPECHRTAVDGLGDECPLCLVKFMPSRDVETLPEEQSEPLPAAQKPKSDHKWQREAFPDGCTVEVIYDIPSGGGFPNIPIGTKSKSVTHCDDGRTYVIFDFEPSSGHSFYSPHDYLRVSSPAPERLYYSGQLRKGIDAINGKIVYWVEADSFDLSELTQEIEERLRADATATAEHARDLMRRHD